MFTKGDKQYLQATFVTKDDLKSFATKNDIARMVSGIVKVDIDELHKELTEKINTLPTKEYFAKRMDDLMTEIKKVRDEQIMHADHHSQIDDRFERVDTHLGVSTAA